MTGEWFVLCDMSNGKPRCINVNQDPEVLVKLRKDRLENPQSIVETTTLRIPGEQKPTLEIFQLVPLEIVREIIEIAKPTSQEG